MAPIFLASSEFPESAIIIISRYRLWISAYLSSQYSLLYMGVQSSILLLMIGGCSHLFGVRAPKIEVFPCLRGLMSTSSRDGDIYCTIVKLRRQPL